MMVMVMVIVMVMVMVIVVVVVIVLSSSSMVTPIPWHVPTSRTSDAPPPRGGGSGYE